MIRAIGIAGRNAPSHIFTARSGLIHQDCSVCSYYLLSFDLPRWSFPPFLWFCMLCSATRTCDTKVTFLRRWRKDRARWSTWFKSSDGGGCTIRVMVSYIIAEIFVYRSDCLWLWWYFGIDVNKRNVAFGVKVIASLTSLRCLFARLNLASLTNRNRTVILF